MVVPSVNSSWTTSAKLKPAWTTLINNLVSNTTTRFAKRIAKRSVHRNLLNLSSRRIVKGGKPVMMYNPSPIIGPGPTGGYLKAKQEALEKKLGLVFKKKTIVTEDAYCPYCDILLEDLSTGNFMEDTARPSYYCTKCNRTW
jgi:hypothetical protein